MRRDTKTVTVASTAFPAHSENTVARRIKDPVTGLSGTKNVPCPLMLEMYNKSIGGVDKSDQLISYHKISRRTNKYWKTIFFHYINIAVVNSHILYNFVCLQQARKPVSEKVFRDKLILDIFSFYGVEKRPHKVSAHKVATFKVCMAASYIRLKIKRSVCIATSTMPKTLLGVSVLIVCYFLHCVKR